MILIIDNYDSFVFNLSRYIEELGRKVNVVRNDKITIQDIYMLQPTHIVISPGPCGPKEAGISIDVVREFLGKIPILGVCLGHQVIGHVFGGEIIKTKEPMHGKSCLIKHNRQGVFSGMPHSFQVARYNSLVVSEKNLSKNITVTSVSNAGEIMSLSSKKFKLVGLQFHPESVLTEHGHALINNFIIGSI
jgi:anthranilate synthase/aminodeoxychorismate synthase-like glutamine amidotransferase